MYKAFFLFSGVVGYKVNLQLIIQTKNTSLEFLSLTKQRRKCYDVTEKSVRSMRIHELDAPIEEFQSSCIGVYLPDAPNVWIVYLHEG